MEYKNTEARRAYFVAYRLANKEKIKANLETSAEKIKTRRAAYNLAKKEAVDAYSKTYYRAHKEAVIAWNRTYQAVHKEKIAERRATEYLNPGVKEHCAKKKAVYREQLTDGYVACALRLHLSLIPKELIELKREQLKTARVYRQLKQVVSQLTKETT